MNTGLIQQAIEELNNSHPTTDELVPLIGQLTPEAHNAMNHALYVAEQGQGCIRRDYNGY